MPYFSHFEENLNTKYDFYTCLLNENIGSLSTYVWTIFFPFFCKVFEYSHNITYSTSNWENTLLLLLGKSYFFHLNNFFIYFTCQHISPHPPLLPFLPLFHLFPHNPLFFDLHSERDRCPTGSHIAWHIKMRQDCAPPLTSRLGQEIQHEEQLPNPS